MDNNQIHHHHALSHKVAKRREIVHWVTHSTRVQYGFDFFCIDLTHNWATNLDCFYVTSKLYSDFFAAYEKKLHIFDDSHIILWFFV